MTLDQLNKIVPLTDAEIEVAKAKNMKLNNFMATMSSLSVEVQVIPLKKSS